MRTASFFDELEKIAKEKKESLTLTHPDEKFLLLSKQKGLPPMILRMLKKTPVGVTVTIDPDYKRNASDKHHMPNGFYTLKGDRIHLTVLDPHILAHELGHAKNSTETLGKIVQNRFLYPMMGFAPAAGYLGGAAAHATKAPAVRALAIGLPFLMTLPGLTAEAKASVNGHEILKKLGATEKDLDAYRSKMMKYFGTYATYPLLTGAMMVGGAAHSAQSGGSHVRVIRTRIGR